MKLSNQIERKFEEVVDVDDWEVYTEDGFQPISKSNKTIPYGVWFVVLENGKTLECADTHILINSDHNEIFAKDSLDHHIITDEGISKVVSVENLYYEENMYDLTIDSDKHTYFTNGILSHNTTTTASFILHFSLFSDAKTSAILANKADQAQEILERIQLSFEMIPLYLQCGVRVYNKRSMKFGNNSRIFTAASGSSSVRGKSLSLLYIDEAAFIPNDMQFYESTYPTISSGKESIIIMNTTPNGTRGMFYKLWKESIANINSYARKIVTWDMVPGRDEEWKQETISNSSEEQFRQEHCVVFKGSSSSLLSGKVLESIPIETPLYNIEDLKIYKEPEEDNHYAMMVDCSEGVGGDYHAVTVIDITTIPYEVVATYKNNTLSPIILPTLLFNVGMKYNEAYILVENQSSGSQVASDLYFDLEYENTLMTITEKTKQVLGFDVNKGKFGVKTSKQVKSIGCANIKMLIEQNKIIINDMDIVNEFGDFVPKNGSYAAASGAHDDLVMTMVLFGWLTTQQYFIDLTDVDLKRNLIDEMSSRSMEKMMPFGIIDDGHVEFDGNESREILDPLSFF